MKKSGVILSVVCIVTASVALSACKSGEDKVVSSSAGNHAEHFHTDPGSQIDANSVQGFISKCNSEGLVGIGALKIKRGMRFHELHEATFQGEISGSWDAIAEITDVSVDSLSMRATAAKIEDRIAEIRCDGLTVERTGCSLKDYGTPGAQYLSCKDEELVSGTMPQAKSLRGLSCSEVNGSGANTQVEVVKGTYQLPDGRVIPVTRITTTDDVKYGCIVTQLDSEEKEEVPTEAAKKIEVRILSGDIPVHHSAYCKQAVIYKSRSYTNSEGTSIATEYTLSYGL